MGESIGASYNRSGLERLMNILSLNIYDLAGLSYNLCSAINRYTDHQATSYTSKVGWIRYPRMSTSKNLVQLANEADVIHINEAPGLLSKLGSLKDKIYIYHAHGQWYRTHKDSIRLPEGTKIIASTADLLEFLPEGAVWFPSVVPVEEYRQKYLIKRNKIPVIYHSSTKPRLGRPILKSLQAVLSGKYDFRVESVEKLRHEDNLRRKAQADIYFDEIVHFYGVNAIEAAGFEMPVIFGATSFSRNYLEDCPFHLVNTKQEVFDYIEDLLRDPELREDHGKKNLQYVRGIHSPRVAVKKFMEIVES